MADLVVDFAAGGSHRPRVHAVMKAAKVWEAAVLDAEQRQQWAQADRARLHWASCLHRLGRCDQAVAVLRQAWDGASLGRRDGRVMAAILCIRLLDRCGRQEEAGAVWSDMEASTTSAVRRRALDDLLSPENSELNDGRAGKHGAVCGYRRREVCPIVDSGVHAPQPTYGAR